MTTNELRLGNRVLFSDYSTEFEVIGIHENGIDVRNENEETYIEIDRFEGIRLTDEILKSLDITCNDYFYKGVGVYWFSGHNPHVPIVYLHEFQNLYFCTRQKELNFKPSQP